MDFQKSGKTKSCLVPRPAVCRGVKLLANQTGQALACLSDLEAPRAQAKNFSTMMPSVRRNLHSRTTCVHSTCGDTPSPCVG